MDGPDDTCPETELPSCGGCRKRKLKCSRQKPLCSNCERLHIPCSYEGRRNKPGLKSGVVDSLSQRLERVENVVFGLGSDDTEPTPHWTSNGQPNNLSSLAGVFTTLATELQKFSQSNDISRAQSDPHQTETQDGGDRYRNPRKRSRYEITRHESLDEPSFRPEGHEVNSLEDLFTSPGLPRLPSNQLDGLSRELLDVYFTRIQPWIPVLHEVSFRVKLESPGELARVMVILQAMAVAALRFLTVEGERLPESYVNGQTKYLRRQVLLEGMGSMRMENLQALMIVAFMEIGDGNLSAAWPIIGSLTRTVEYLGLSVETEDHASRPAIIWDSDSIPAPVDWLEEEERRRVFWNIFILDRFSSTTKGWNTSLTAADVCRRLPVCGGKWYYNEPASTPYFGIWDRSVAKIGNSIAFLPGHYPSPSQSIATSQGDTDPSIVDMSNAGAFAYYIESIESLSQITTYFLRVKVDYNNRREISNWLTRFKELDLRLVHWKMYLPHQWKDSGMSREVMPGVMDPNMTVANATHNISMILLHQRIAYPDVDLSGIRLPSECSADTCCNAAVETAYIIHKYLEGLPADRPMSPQLGVCAYVSARVLLVHRHYYKTKLADEYELLMSSLQAMHCHWRGESARQVEPQRQQSRERGTSFFLDLRQHLATLDRNLREIPGYTISVSGSITAEGTAFPSQQSHATTTMISDQPNNEHQASLDRNSTTHPNHPTFSLAAPTSGGNQDRIDRNNTIITSSSSNMTGTESGTGWPTIGITRDDIATADNLTYNAHSSIKPSTLRPHTHPHPNDNKSNSGTSPHSVDELSAISQILMDNDFLGMDRIISFDDMMASDDLFKNV